MCLDFLIEILEISRTRNGKDFPLTVGHLLNICKMAERWEYEKEFARLEATRYWEEL